MELEQARANFFEAIKGEGTHCPCCDRWGKINSHTLSKAKARALVWLFQAGRKDPGGWVNVPAEAPKEMLRTNQFTTMKHWRLVEKAGNDNPKLKSSGIWRVTPEGEYFLKNVTKLSKKAYVYNDKLMGFGGELVSIGEIHGDFDYNAMLHDLYKDRK